MVFIYKPKLVTKKKKERKEKRDEEMFWQV